MKLFFFFGRGLVVKNFVSPFFGQVFQFAVDVFEPFLSGDTREKQEQVGQLAINNQAKGGGTEHDNQIENVADDHKSMRNREIADNVKNINKDAGEVKTADDNQLGGISGIGEQNCKGWQHADQQDDCERQGGQEHNQKGDEGAPFLKRRQFFEGVGAGRRC